MEGTPRYSLDVANQPDSDLHYAVQVYRDGEHVKTIYDPDRVKAAHRAKLWAERDKGYDPTDVQRIYL